MHRAIATLLLMLTAQAAAAQQAQPYAGGQQRQIKALSAEQIADLHAGRGMGLALAAELNGYPGPVHVLEHADALGLSSDQRQQTQALFDRMKQEAVALGAKLIREEAALDTAFASRTITPQSLADATDAIGRTQAALRAVHLRYHLAQVAILSPQQSQRYAELRGYGGGHPPARHPHHKH